VISEPERVALEGGEFEWHGLPGFAGLLVVAVEPRPDAENGHDRQQQGTQQPGCARAVADAAVHLQVDIGVGQRDRLARRADQRMQARFGRRVGKRFARILNWWVGGWSTQERPSITF
jgi:hypothetical protein